MTYVLGITSSICYNTSAAILKNGRLIAMAEEERFNRIKHSPRIHPQMAIDFCLKYAGITLEDVDSIVISGTTPKQFFKLRALYRLKRTWSLPNLFFHDYKEYKHISRNNFFKENNKKLFWYPHHLAHAASSYFCSGFKESNIISWDALGDINSTVLGIGKNKIDFLECYGYQNSMGALYADFTEFLGFRPHSQEGKTMGLSSYGKPVYDMSDMIIITENGYFRKPIYGPLDFIKSFTLSPNKVKFVFFERKFGSRRNRDEKITKKHQNIAATIQKTMEKLLINLSEILYKKTNLKKICLAGGCALNCNANSAVLRQDFVKDIFIQPAANDAGTSLGAALLKTNSKFKMDHAYWGPEFDNEEIKNVLKDSGFKYEYHDDISGVTAELLTKNEIIGWFQGRMEIGPRALGNRSILADPTNANIKNDVNIKVKHREVWRPFAPSLLERAAKEYLEDAYPSPFMILTFFVPPEKIKEIPSVVHVDGSTRPQTVEKKVNKRYYKLIEAFEDLTSVPVILNTSFNDKGEPIVCTPQDAINTFRKTGLDYLAIGNYLVSK